MLYQNNTCGEEDMDNHNQMEMDMDQVIMGHNLFLHLDMNLEEAIM